ncbi:MAG TPA: AI-2E family transporter [Thermosynechococcaceae cyanobacterium]
MPTDSWQSLKPWLILPFLALNGWVLLQVFQYFEPLVTILTIAAVLAFVLNYPIKFLQKSGLKRGWAVLLVLVVALIALGALAVTLIPVLLEEVTELGAQLPNWLNSIVHQLQKIQDWAASHRLPINLKRLVNQLSDRLPGSLEGIADDTLVFTLEAVGGLTNILLTLVLTLYLLLDGRRVWDGVFSRLPIANPDRIRKLLQDNFQSYFIGQATLSLLMGVLFSVAFLILGVPYGLLLGLIVGLMTLIPFGDVLAFGSMSLLIMTQDFGLGVRMLVTSLAIDQIVDQAVTPRVLGSFTGLKPVWVLLSLLLGTKFVGIAGLITAVPLAGFLGDWLSNDPISGGAIDPAPQLEESAIVPVPSTLPTP